MAVFMAVAVAVVLCGWLAGWLAGWLYFCWLSGGWLGVGRSQNTKSVCAKKLVEPPKTAAEAESQVWSVLSSQAPCFDFGKWHSQARCIANMTKQVRRCTCSGGL